MGFKVFRPILSLKILLCDRRWTPVPDLVQFQEDARLDRIASIDVAVRVAATVAQMLVAGALVYAEASSYWSIMSELDRRVREDEEMTAKIEEEMNTVR